MTSAKVLDDRYVQYRKAIEFTSELLNPNHVTIPSAHRKEGDTVSVFSDERPTVCQIIKAAYPPQWMKKAKKTIDTCFHIFTQYSCERCRKMQTLATTMMVPHRNNVAAHNSVNKRKRGSDHEGAQKYPHGDLGKRSEFQTNPTPNSPKKIDHRRLHVIKRM